MLDDVWPQTHIRYQNSRSLTLYTEALHTQALTKNEQQESQMHFLYGCDLLNALDGFCGEEFETQVWV